jgi:hypothetical protein
MMKRAIGLLALALLVAGCGDSAKPKADAGVSTDSAAKPLEDDTRTCIVAYLGQCGWKEVELVSVTQCDQVPKEAQSVAASWAYTFTAKYTDVFGERQTRENWLAVISKIDGRASVKCCYDGSRHLVGGHRGDERGDTANLIALPPADDLPAIIPPKQ